jgi:hypothetical protein
MIWKKARLITWVADGGFRIVEVPDAELPYRLDSPCADGTCFPTLDQAKAFADLQNKLVLAEADNARLRTELDGRGAGARKPLNRAFIADLDADAAQQESRKAWQEMNDDAEAPDLRITPDPVSP